ncbi:MAG: amino acid deaminase, partial [Comamonadaceae bacterium]
MAPSTPKDPLLDPLFDTSYKGYPRTQAARPRSAIAAAGWNVLAGDLPLPLAVLKREALEHNVAWMQAQVDAWGVSFAPHGKTTMSPQLFRRQLDAGAWGITFATVTQLAVGVAAGTRRALIANQVVSDEDLGGIQQLLAAHAGLRIVFLVDSTAQLALIDDWAARHAGSGRVPFEVMLELGIDGARTGCRTHSQAVELARRLRESPATRLVGIECYEGQGATGDSAADRAYADALMDRVDAIAREAVANGWFECEEVLVSAALSPV